MYKVYKLTVPNGKAYIGITKQEKLYDRFQYGSGYDHNKEFFADILEYGWKNIKQEVLIEVESKEKALRKEGEYILKYQTNNKDKGYNTYVNTKKPKKLIRNIETGEIFKSLREAAEVYGVSHETIRLAIINERPWRGYHWERISSDDLIS